MKYPTAYLLLIIVLFGATSASAQSVPPPPPAPDYFPQSWKEYVYETDGVKIRFPKEPEITASSVDVSYGEVTTLKYHHHSFIELELAVTEFPSTINLEDTPVEDLMETLRDGGLAEIKEFNPKIIKESDIMVDGYAAKFMQIETSNGKVVRCKFFVAKNRMYFLSAEVKKGEKHGVNYENDFEKVAMGFLDSVKLISPKR